MAIELPIGAGLSPLPPPTLRQMLTGSTRLTTTRSSNPSRLRSTTAPPRPTLVVDDAGLLGALHERTVGLTEEQIVGVSHRVVRLRFDIALGDEEVQKTVVVDISELGVPRRRRQDVVARVWSVGSGAELQGDVFVRRLSRPVRQRLQLVVTLTGEVHLGIPVTRHVRTGDAHSPDLHGRQPSASVYCCGAAPVSTLQSCSDPSR